MFCNFSKIKRVCALDTMYTLLQYLLLSSEEEWSSTYFFWLGNIDGEVKKYFEGQNVTLKPHMSFWELLKMYYITTVFKWPFLLKKNIKRYASDHIGFECIVCRKYPFELLEDGLLCYVEDYPYKWESKRFSRLKSFLIGPLFSPKDRVGDEYTCTKIHLTGLKYVEILNDPKVVVQSFSDMWNSSSQSKKRKILDAFGIGDEMLDSLSGKKWIILTQPFSEDNVIQEESKIAAYSKIINYINDIQSIVIKPHPREKTDYEKCFPGVKVLKSRAPIQLFSLCGIKFENMCTICSTAAYGFPYNYNLYYFGTEIDPVLNEKIPNGRLSKIGPLPPNINLVTTL